MYEALTLTECDHAPVYEPSWEHEWTRYKWYAECERDETVIYANFQGKDPREEKVEINVRRECFMPSEEHVDFITLSGFYIEKAATTWAPPAAYQDGMVGPHWPMAGSLRTVKSSTANAVEFLLANIMMQKMIITLPVSM